MPRPSSTEPRVRLNLEISVSLRDRMDYLKKLSEADSTTEVIRRAVMVYEKLLTLEGQLILREADGSEQQLLLLP